MTNVCILPWFHWKSLLVIRLSCTISLALALFVFYKCQSMDWLITINMIDSENELEFCVSSSPAVVVVMMRFSLGFRLDYDCGIDRVDSRAKHA